MVVTLLDVLIFIRFSEDDIEEPCSQAASNYINTTDESWQQHSIIIMLKEWNFVERKLIRCSKCLIMAINLLSAAGRCQLWSKGHLAWEIKIYLLYFSISKYDLDAVFLCQTDHWMADWRCCWWNSSEESAAGLENCQIWTKGVRGKKRILILLLREGVKNKNKKKIL